MAYCIWPQMPPRRDDSIGTAEVFLAGPLKVGMAVFIADLRHRRYEGASPGGILINAERASFLKLVESIVSTLEANAQRLTSHCRKHVPNAVAHHDSRFNRRAQSCCSREKKIRIGLGIFL